MTVQELIDELKKYPKDLKIALVNTDDDTNDSNIALKANDISKEEIYDEYEEKLTGEYFLAICHNNSVHSD